MSMRIYAYSDSNPIYAGLLKIGETSRSVKERVKEQYPTLRPGVRPYSIVLDESAAGEDGIISDHDIHKHLHEYHSAGEWFKCTVDDVRNAILELRDGIKNPNNCPDSFKMRPEQEAAVEQTSRYYINENNSNGPPEYLWNAKMRFGKTFTAYQLVKKMDWKRVLILTFKPAVERAWHDDLKNHVDFTDWEFISTNTQKNIEDVNSKNTVICFGSLQDYNGKTENGDIKEKNKIIHDMDWDCVIFDEYHYGAWNDNTKELINEESNEEQLNKQDYFDKTRTPIKANHRLYLSGTPFRAIDSGEFIEDQIFNWTYSDEQKAKHGWEGDNNPYKAMPEMIMHTYRVPDDIKDITDDGEFNEFNLNVFFSATDEGDNARFIYENEVQKWLSLIRGSYSIKDDLKFKNKVQMPFADKNLLSALKHTVWFLPNVSSCYAMRNLLNNDTNTFYADYDIVVAAGNKAGMGIKAIEPVNKAMTDEPRKTKTITLSCGKLMTGVTVKPWGGIFMLRNLTTPETYFQAAFRVQSAWETKNQDGRSPNETKILKEKCYIFDFAPNRALKQVADYACRLDVTDTNNKTKIEEFIKFLPVLSYDGGTMEKLDATAVLDHAMSGMTTSLLATRWQSPLLINLDINILQQIIDNTEALAAVCKITHHRTLNNTNKYSGDVKANIETIINESKNIQDLKNEDEDDNKKQISKKDKELIKLRKEIQEKLSKFLTRIPLFMYLTDYREECLIHVIQNLDSKLFEKTCGLTIKDFNVLLELNVFNERHLNDAIYKFKRYEDGSFLHINNDM